tara:strand:+ start:16559 stop:17170 length:612 start_codon:yes stop_codon:yes gene_type:complete
MPKIVLKYKSPEFEDQDTQSAPSACDMPGCPSHGEHKAPKHRGLNDYYFFCFNHIKEYNKAWDFFAGMSAHEVQNHMQSSLYGDRPTWRADVHAEQKLHEAAQNTYYFSDGEQDQQAQGARTNTFAGDTNTPEYEAMAIMGISPPVTLEEIKTRYKTLAKKYHPDLNKNDSDAEELLKKINMAYTILKLAFQEYSKLEKRDVK